MPLLLEQDPDGGRGQLPGVPLPVPGEPGRLQAAHRGGPGQDQGGEEAEGHGEEAADLGEPQAPRQRQSRPEEPRLRRRALAAARRLGHPAEARVLRQVRQDPQGRDKPQHLVRGQPEPGQRKYSIPEKSTLFHILTVIYSWHGSSRVRARART